MTVVNTYIVYQFLRRLTTPINKWDAFKTGVIDKNGNIITPKNKRTPEQSKSFDKFDLLVLKIKKLLSKIPGGSSRLASYAAALWFIKEHNEDYLMYLDEDKFNHYLEQANILFEDVAIANNVGGGNIAGMGVPAGPGPGEPGLTKAQMKRYKNKNAVNKMFTRKAPTIFSNN